MNRARRRSCQFSAPWLALATVAIAAFRYKIANGLTAGLIRHPVLKLLAGRPREVTAGSAVLAAACLAYYAFGLPH